MLKKIYFFTVLLLAISCNQKTAFVLENGDLLFLGSAAGDLSEAINTVTQTENATDYSHIALVEKKGNQIWVLHAAPENGSERITLADFLAYAKKDSSVVVAYRIKPEYPFHADTAVAKAKKMLGKPYNYSYILTDTAYYCSDFVYWAYEKDSVFTMNPMTFKDPVTGEIHPTWVSHYAKMGLEAPEGFPGCNPNGMATSEKLQRVGEVE